MPVTERRIDRGLHDADRTRRTLGDELRHARLGAGLSQGDVGAAAGVSGSLVSRIERGHIRNVSVEVLTRLFAVLGMRLSSRPYPHGTPLRDRAHARLLERFRRELGPPLHLRTEVPLRIPGDSRAWDGRIVGSAGDCRVEAETVLHDLQSTDRRIATKMKDDDIECLLLLVADTHRNRRILREFRGLLAQNYPLEPRHVLAELRAGRVPRRNGVVVL